MKEVTEKKVVKKLKKKLVKGVTLEEYYGSDIVEKRLAALMEDASMRGAIESIDADELVRKAKKHFDRKLKKMRFNNGKRYGTLHDIEEMIKDIPICPELKTVEDYQIRADELYKQFKVPEAFRKKVRVEKSIQFLDELQELKGYVIGKCSGDDEKEVRMELFNQLSGKAVTLLFDGSVFTHRRIRRIDETVDLVDKEWED